eukprot:GHVS01010351.1.p1 GENE.GHVS01010351.1~~GHVS01010351.1.p1  ORF type:complete len:1078 (-),score=204.76 GHVS01010351.1:136-3369(-)
MAEEDASDALLLTLLDYVPGPCGPEEEEGEQENNIATLKSFLHPLGGGDTPIRGTTSAGLSGLEKKGRLVECCSDQANVEVRRTATQTCMYEVNQDGRRIRVKLPENMITRGHRIRRIMEEKGRQPILHSSYNRLKLGGRAAVMNLMKAYLNKVFRIPPDRKSLEMITAACCYISARKYDNIPVAVREVAAKLDCRRFPSRRTLTMLIKLISHLCSTLGIKSLPVDLKHEEMAARLLNKVRDSSGALLARHQATLSGDSPASSHQSAAGGGTTTDNVLDHHDRGGGSGHHCRAARRSQRRESFASGGEEQDEKVCIEVDVIGDMLKAIRDDVEGSALEEEGSGFPSGFPNDSSNFLDFLTDGNRSYTDGPSEDIVVLDRLTEVDGGGHLERRATPLQTDETLAAEGQRQPTEAATTNDPDSHMETLGEGEGPPVEPLLDGRQSADASTGGSSPSGRARSGVQNGKSGLRRLPEVVDKLNNKDLTETIVEVFKLLWHTTHTQWADTLTQQLCPYWAAATAVQEGVDSCVESSREGGSSLVLKRDVAAVLPCAHRDVAAPAANRGSSSGGRRKGIKTGVLLRRDKSGRQPSSSSLSGNVVARLGTKKDWVQQQSCSFGCEDPLANQWRARGMCMYSEVSSLLLIILENLQVPLSRKDFGRILGVHPSTMTLHCGRIYMLLYRMFSLYHAEQCAHFAALSTNASPYCWFLKTLDNYWREKSSLVTRRKGLSKQPSNLVSPRNCSKKASTEQTGNYSPLRVAAAAARRRRHRTSSPSSSADPSEEAALVESMVGGGSQNGCTQGNWVPNTTSCADKTGPSSLLSPMRPANLCPRRGRVMTPQNSLLGDLSDPRLSSLFSSAAFVAKLRPSVPTTANCPCWICRRHSVDDSAGWLPSCSSSGNSGGCDETLPALLANRTMGLAQNNNEETGDAILVDREEPSLKEGGGGGDSGSICSKVEADYYVQSILGVDDSETHSQCAFKMTSSAAVSSGDGLCCVDCDGGATCSLAYCSRSGSELRLRRAYAEFHLRAIMGQQASWDQTTNTRLNNTAGTTPAKYSYAEGLCCLSRFCDFVERGVQQH